jgi:hypothetical protein
MMMISGTLLMTSGQIDSQVAQPQTNKRGVLPARFPQWHCLEELTVKRYVSGFAFRNAYLNDWMRIHEEFAVLVGFPHSNSNGNGRWSSWSLSLSPAFN